MATSWKMVFINCLILSLGAVGGLVRAAEPDAVVHALVETAGIRNSPVMRG